MSRQRILVLGADAAGMSAAHQALRTARSTGRDVEVIALEKTQDTSYSACGIPYWIAGDVDDSDELVARSAEGHRAMGVDLITGATATGLDIDRGEVTYSKGGSDTRVGYDSLVIATGASAVVPTWARQGTGDLVPGVVPVKTLTDGELWIQHLTSPSAGPRRRVIVAGGGYIGVEMAEAARRRGYDVTLLTRSTVMASLDPDMGARIAGALETAGIHVVTGCSVAGLTQSGGTVTGVLDAAGNHWPCDLLVLALGVVPATEFAASAGLPTGRSGGLLAEPDGSLTSSVWAAGDCCEARHRTTGDWVFVPLGTHANKQGRVVGNNVITPKTRQFGGVLGTAVTRFVHGSTHLEIARTGLNVREASAAGLDVQVLVTEGRTASGYMPESSPAAVKMLADPRTRELLGAQIVGGPGSGKRIDTVAAVLWSRGSVDDLAEMDLAYAPPFATVWEIVQLAARRLADAL